MNNSDEILGEHDYPSPQPLIELVHEFEGFKIYKLFYKQKNHHVRIFYIVMKQHVCSEKKNFKFHRNFKSKRIKCKNMDFISKHYKFDT